MSGHKTADKAEFWGNQAKFEPHVSSTTGSGRLECGELAKHIPLVTHESLDQVAMAFDCGPAVRVMGTGYTPSDKENSLRK